jgi:hypothetical protein
MNYISIINSKLYLSCTGPVVLRIKTSQGHCCAVSLLPFLKPVDDMMWSS